MQLDENVLIRGEILEADCSFHERRRGLDRSVRDKDLLNVDLLVFRSEVDPPRSLFGLGRGQPNALIFERGAVDRQFDVVPTVVLSRLSAFVCQSHNVNPGRGSWRLVHQVIDRN